MKQPVVMDGRIAVTLAVPCFEIETYRLGPEAYIVMLARSVTTTLEAQGAIGPFEFYCTGLGSAGYCFIGREQ